MNASMESASATVVLGMGNLLLSDDGMGIHALQYLERDPRVPPGIEFVDAGTFGVELIGYTAGATRLIVLDSVNVGAAPGTLIRMEGDELEGLPPAGNVHDLSLADLMMALRLLNQEPKEVILIGIQPARTDPGTTLSPAVQATLSSLVDVAVRELLETAPET